jgi:hypothetical protein
MRGRSLVSCLLALSCSSSVILSPEVGSGGSRSGTGGSSQVGGTSSVANDAGADTGGKPGDVIGTGGTGGASPGAGGFANVCTEVFLDSEPVPLDLYLMFDQSASMGDPVPGANPPMTWWQGAQAAVAKFVKEPRADGSRPGYAPMSVGIQFFPLNGVAPESCTADYQTPEVEVAELPGNATKIAAAIQQHQPTLFRPTAAALSGALAHMKARAMDHPSHGAIVVLVTGGFPTECDPRDITDLAHIAKTALETVPKVHTAVIGLNLGAGGASLNELAVAGGTNKAVLINGGDIASQLVDALLNIEFEPQVCKFDVPMPAPGQTLDVSQVAVLYTSVDTMMETKVPQLDGPMSCASKGDDGWFYDSPTSPTQIELCPGTCGKLEHGVLKVVAGCEVTGGAP